MIPAAPRSSARPIRKRSADWGRTSGAIGVVADGVQHGQEVCLGRRPVLQVEHHPIEAGLAAQLDGQRRGQVGEHADQRLAARMRVRRSAMAR